MGGEAIYMIYGTDKFVFGTMGVGKKTPGGHGIFGGYPPDLQENKYVLDSNIPERFKASKSTTTFEELDLLEGNIFSPPANFFAIPVKQFDIILFRWGAGGGYGDPLERDPKAVLRDVETNANSYETAKNLYGVIIKQPEFEIDYEATEKLRGRLREERLALGNRQKSVIPAGDIKNKVMKFHEYLEIVEKISGEKVIVCSKCCNHFCSATENYKKWAIYRESEPVDIRGAGLASGEKPFVTYQEYICPGCGTLLEVDVLCRELEDEESKIIWDARILDPVPEHT
jgi:N-methylhydantoinase B